MKTAEQIEHEASSAITALLAAGKGRDATALGEVLGNWRKRRVGDSLLRTATENARRAIAKALGR